MDETPVVTAFLRNEGDILLLERSGEVESYAGRWGAVAGHTDETPSKAIQREIEEETGLDQDAITFVRQGNPFTVTDSTLETQWIVHPFLFDSETRSIETNWETETAEWTAPTEILRRDTVPELWESYDRVRPRVQTVTDDRVHGSTYLSIRALEVLRDEAGLASANPDSSIADPFDRISTIAMELVAARPSMTVLENRINRLMGTTQREPTAIEQAAHDAIKRALQVDEAAARAASSGLAGRVATLSRSETVLKALEAAVPAAVLVAESRPGREGIPVVERLSDSTEVTLTTDTGFAQQIARFAVDTLVFGADSILADGTVVNKVGTRSAAIAAHHTNIRVIVVASSDKIRTDTTYDLEPRDPTEVYAGSRNVSVVNPTFDLTPASVIDAIFTEDGRLDTAETQNYVNEFEKHATWQDE